MLWQVAPVYIPIAELAPDFVDLFDIMWNVLPYTWKPRDQKYLEIFYIPSEDWDSKT